MTTNPRNNSKPKINVLLFASYQLVLESFKSFLNLSGEINVVDSTISVEELPGLAQKKEYDVVVLCLLEEETGNLEIIPQLQEIDSDVRLLVLTGSSDIDSHQRAVEFGAAGIVRKEQDGKTLLRAIRQVHEGGTWFNQKLLSQILNKNGNGAKTKDWETTKIEYLTHREREIISVITQGMNNKEIAENLNISEATVRHHLSSIYSKLELDDRLNLVIFAYQHKLAEIKRPNSESPVAKPTIFSP